MPYTAGGGVTLDSGSLTPFGAGGLVSFSEPNGSYSYTITAGSGYEWVSATPPAPLSVRGGAFPVTVTFEALYSVSFAETGLPSATSWTVTVDGFTVASATGPISFTESNGTYTYTITAVPGWHQATLPYAGSVTVSGSNVVEPELGFTVVTYTALFIQSGLPAGTRWFVNITESSSFSMMSQPTGASLAVSLPNGTYAYTVATGAMFVPVGSGAERERVRISPRLLYHVRGHVRGHLQSPVRGSSRRIVDGFRERDDSIQHREVPRGRAGRDRPDLNGRDADDLLDERDV